MRLRRSLVALVLAATAGTAVATMPATAVAAVAAAPLASEVSGAGLDVTDSEQVAPGVRLESFTSSSASAAAIQGELLTVDLRNPHVSVDLLHPPAVAQAQRVSQMADALGAVGGVNGDFFNNTEAQHPGVAFTDSSDGPEIARGRALKAAVPNGQRFGPGMPPGVTTQAVFGVGVDGVGRLGNASLEGSVRIKSVTRPLGGLNQYAIPVGGIGAYTSAWGATSRARSVCGTDTSRGAACSTDTTEVTLRHGKVVAVGSTVGAGAISTDETVLVGREAGADELRTLKVGQHVTVKYDLSTGRGVPFRFAVGGFPILENGTVVAGQDAKTAAVRTGAGFSADGRTMFLVAVQAAPGTSGGMTTPEVAQLLQRAGAANAVNLDGGGSTTLVARDPGAHAVTVRNRPTDGAGERSVANGIGVFVR
ncbi:phosphodiester glycosidase family protein [Amycolatopsis rhabdoformis]|uniref:Phosphodiester glycosidase family protein n=1 Tax=Amycolatopsis rhabdoformis TaxID=1448059 RepID=A0ABZ1I343_9PSEU|nr:phosphodiester glycosidase family protein [Amycolatopsis rhabdoformis]WSE28815.1 phosphodiester glycosidase family protein [Amycolatopsis rhabdoformis]